MAVNVPYHDRDRSYEWDDPLNPNYDPSAPPLTQEQAPNGPEPGAEDADPDPWGTAPTDGNWQAWFLRNVQGMPATPESLAALEAKLSPHGIKVLRNASGIAGKIQLPDGKVFDVGRAFSSGDPSQMAWQWLDDSDAGVSTTGTTEPQSQVPLDLDWFDELAGPEPYVTPERPDGLDPYVLPERPSYLQGEYVAPQFEAPSFDELKSDPGYLARMDAMQRGLERSAAAKGSILSGGFLGQTMPREMGNFAANEYANLYARRYNTFQGNAGLNMDARRLNEGAYQTDAGLGMAGRQMNEGFYQNDVSNAFNQYGQRYRTYRDAVNDQFRLTELGANTTMAGAPR